MTTPSIAVSYIDDGTGARDPRPTFRRLIAKIQRMRSRFPIIVVRELTRLFRNSADRREIDHLLAAGRAHVHTIREGFDTSTEEGRRCYTEMADLICLAYEGIGRPDLPEGSPADARRELVERYVARVLARWFELLSVPREEYALALVDVRARLLALTYRWGSPEILPLLAPYLEVAAWHEPREVSVQVRALVTVAIRNSALEDLHLSDHIEQADWRVLTMAATHFFAPLTKDQRSVTETLSEDPFAGLDVAYPCAYRAFAALACLQSGETATWEMPVIPAHGFPAGDASIQRNDKGAEILHAMDERISALLSDLIQTACTEAIPLFFPSLKHLSRNPRKLFRVVEIVLTNRGTILTQNVLLAPGRVARRARLVDYNNRSCDWWPEEQGERRDGAKPGRDAPCPCGSGKKFKRCCGR